jgi:hypothetical protein
LGDDLQDLREDMRRDPAPYSRSLPLSVTAGCSRAAKASELEATGLANASMTSERRFDFQEIAKD